MTVRVVRNAGAGRDASEPPRPKPGLASVVSSVFKAEIQVSDYEQLEQDLSLRDHTRPEDVRRAINLAAKNASKAHRLYVVAKVEFDHFDAECERFLSRFRDAAVKSLTKDFATGVRGGMKKQITDKDVQGRMIRLFPDEVLAALRRREEATRTVAHLYRLAELWKERAFSLSKLL